MKGIIEFNQKESATIIKHEHIVKCIYRLISAIYHFAIE